MKQVEPETMKWRAARTQFLGALSTALDSGDFSQVPLDQLALLSAGEEGAPITKEMDDKLVAGYLDGSLKSDDQVSIQQQVATLESARRANLSLRFCRALALGHAKHERDQYKSMDMVMTQEFVGIRKAP